ncbi:MAG: NAD-dependent protein deacylase [bacterium]
MTESLLTRWSDFSSSRYGEGPTSLQKQVDTLVSRSTEEISDWKTLTAMGAGSLFYRLGRIGTLALPLGAPGRFLSYGAGLASEATAFQGVNDLLNSDAGKNLSYSQRWRATFLQFGLLKMGGAFSSGQNLLAQHAFQDAAMVMGNRITAAWGLAPAPEGDLPEQFLHAEITNLQLGAGMSLFHLSAPGLASFERGIDLSLRAQETGFGKLPITSLSEIAFRKQAAAVSGASVPGEVSAPEGWKPLLMSMEEGKKGDASASSPLRGAEVERTEEKPEFDFPPELIEKLRTAQHIAVLTGAGISKESGIPTFREAMEGFWSTEDMMELVNPVAFLKNPGRVWQWHMEMKAKYLHARPNPGHDAIARMEGLVPKLTLITQNVDNLHQEAGSARVLELHGSMKRVKCSEENRVVESWTETEQVPPPCPHCGAPLRPDVVWFKELLPEEELREAIGAARTADVFLVVGTSGLVQPAAMLPKQAMFAKKTVVEVNPDETEISQRVSYSLKGPSGLILPALIETVWPNTKGEEEK